MCFAFLLTLGDGRYPADVREVILGETGILNGLQSGGVVSPHFDKRESTPFNESMHVFCTHIRQLSREAVRVLKACEDFECF